MNKNKYLITGCAGFIGFHLTKSLLKDGFEVYGVDNLNNYYNVSLKNDRLTILNKYENFHFKKVDISNNTRLETVFKSFSPDFVINLAAQAGVRYSIENPNCYVKSNIVGFCNVIELAKKYDVDGLIYASSSSVYGNNDKIPFSINDSVNKPISLYAATKISNELIAHSYYHLFGLHTTGLRFFTVYGPWGRPDMAYYIFTKKITNKKQIEVFNRGKMKRDFTYIDDIVKGIRSAIEKNYKNKVFNLGNNSSEQLMDLIKYLEVHIVTKAKIDFRPMQLGDVKQTYADIDYSKEKLNYNPKVNLNQGIKKFVDWYLKYYKISNNE